MITTETAPFKDCTVVILAGGQASRMGRLGQFSVKPALVAYDCPLLVRLLDQACSMGYAEIIISTSPAHFYALDELVTSYQRKANPIEDVTSLSKIRLMSTDAHHDGSLEALGAILNQVSTARCVMCLGDIFFLHNPFLSLASWVLSEEICLGVAEAVLPEDLTQGGLVFQEGQRVITIIEQPQLDAKSGLRWSGLALFNTTLAIDLTKFITNAPKGSPEGDFFGFCLNQGRQIVAVRGPDFVNVNSPQQLLLAGLYALLEKDDNRTGIHDILANTALLFRQELAISGRPI